MNQLINDYVFFVSNEKTHMPTKSPTKNAPYKIGMSEKRIECNATKRKQNALKETKKPRNTDRKRSARSYHGHLNCGQ